MRWDWEYTNNFHNHMDPAYSKLKHYLPQLRLQVTLKKNIRKTMPITMFDILTPQHS